MTDVINLYTMSGCPRCNVLKKRCANSKYIATTDFKVVTIDPTNELDTDVQLLKEKGITSMPIMLVNDTFYDFDSAMKFLTDME
nr:hypothetical protein DGKKSRWO_DGKKSRWO_CDS_0133 [uncultured phage]CAI9752310.1 hypothetical protein CVNMHQAP_CVNMHQAP_CDS_0133 [uncultured phage]